MTGRTNSSTIVKFVFLCLLVFLIFSVVNMQMELNALKEKRSELENTLTDVKDKIEEINLRLETPIDSEGYMERLAREKLGYCFPGDIIYFNDLIN